jgi:hypothetical protein
MSVHANSPTSKSGKSETSLLVLGSHITWIFLGPLAMILVLLGLGQNNRGWLTLLDGFYFFLMAWIVFARWVDQKSGQSHTAEGKPSTWADFRRYVYIFVPLAIVLWIGANILANHL